MKKKKSNNDIIKSQSSDTLVETDNESAKESINQNFPIVGLGASAGGLEALKEFFSHVSLTSGMAYIVVVHLSPNQPSILTEILQRVSKIPIVSAIDGQVLEPDHVYILPPNKEINIYKGTIQLFEILEKNPFLAIDIFLRSLAQDQGKNAVAIILSGSGSDGTLGVREIKFHDGLVLVQSEDSAAYDSMPKSAIGTGLVDLVLPPEQMPSRLEQLLSFPQIEFKDESLQEKPENWLNKVFSILQTRLGYDFSSYKLNTLSRRINRRMSLNQINSYAIYLRFLRENPQEIESLFRELLIGVTSFFRDKESFDILHSKFLIPFIDQLQDGSTFRVWIPGCSTGEEAYSIAIILHEYIEKTTKRIELQVFGTDIDKYAIEKAREGLYPISISADVNEIRLNRFFTKEGNFYRIHKNIRDCLVFSVQDIINDPPFSRLNLLCCRNLLIYLNTEAQKKLIPIFHYTLMKDSILMLGSSETIGGFTNLFEIVDKKWKIHRRLEVPRSLKHYVSFPSKMPAYDTNHEIVSSNFNPPEKRFEDIAKQAILDQFAPAAALINAKGDILYIHGRVGKYLEPPSGPPSQNIIDMSREGLRIELSSSIRTAFNTNENVTRKKIAVKSNGDTQMINLHVRPQKVPKELAGRFLVVFEEIVTQDAITLPDSDASNQSKSHSSTIEELERELQLTRENQQTTIEELESSNEELKSTNEEMQSANEELQSTNEELESSKEEMQSLNEELQTINAELENKIEELSAVRDDIRNLLNGLDLAIIIVDNNLRISRFTSEAIKIINLIHSDIGRPLDDVKTNLKNYDLIIDLKMVINKLIPVKMEVQTATDSWYLMQILPYRTSDNRISGAVLTFSPIDEQKKVQEKLWDAYQKTENYNQLIRKVFDINPDPMLVLDKDCKIMIANKTFLENNCYFHGNMEGAKLSELNWGLNTASILSDHLDKALTLNQNFSLDPMVFELFGGKQKYSVYGKIIEKENKSSYRILIQFIKIDLPENGNDYISKPIQQI